MADMQSGVGPFIGVFLLQRGIAVVAASSIILLRQSGGIPQDPD
jgi:hypothetical protein